MARPTLPAIVLAVLAVAGPAAADAGAPTDPASPEGELVETDLDRFLEALLLVAMTTEVAGFQPGAYLPSADGEFSCDLYDLTLPGPNTPATESFMLDPDGCLRSFVRRSIGWPPAVETDADAFATDPSLTVSGPTRVTDALA